MPLPDMESHWDPFATNASTVHEPTSVSNDELYLSWFQTADTGEGGCGRGPHLSLYMSCRSGIRDACTLGCCGSLFHLTTLHRTQIPIPRRRREAHRP